MAIRCQAGSIPFSLVAAILPDDFETIPSYKTRENLTAKKHNLYLQNAACLLAKINYTISRTLQTGKKYV